MELIGELLQGLDTARRAGLPVAPLCVELACRVSRAQALARLRPSPRSPPSPPSPRSPPSPPSPPSPRSPPSPPSAQAGVTGRGHRRRLAEAVERLGPPVMLLVQGCENDTPSLVERASRDLRRAIRLVDRAVSLGTGGGGDS
ncbi:uncharacterized protein LOC144739645 [Lampetra planeri]